MKICYYTHTSLTKENNVKGRFILYRFVVINYTLALVRVTEADAGGRAV